MMQQNRHLQDCCETLQELQRTFSMHIVSLQAKAQNLPDNWPEFADDDGRVQRYEPKPYPNEECLMQTTVGTNPPSHCHRARTS
ncbi:hypothetical protein MPTK1_7g15080 [Marchantia polymorpha subsp. ruderalis]|uniref:Uncharacterized protein n=2 Tax=Marchantia polymorpha TaxID=3197 RepID=A0AAF6BZS1_MARPO|nr:hypothetical protein MARPO_0009s0192 [Marchantia polymorpha]BBN17505.1 hypothetical protein Mp_7g15080 [Marchantia polymorpha subsp. ruderalis]|eukprot:PTQ47111.1 hypothetical protein MARPO_0009s0192 [Marchantia polymorpha]